MKRKVKVKTVAENEKQDKCERPGGEEQKSAETEQKQKSVKGEGGCEG